jgi:Uma2 family endonuclease
MSEPAISLDDAGYQNLRAVADRLLETTRVEYVDEGVLLIMNPPGIEHRRIVRAIADDAKRAFYTGTVTVNWATDENYQWDLPDSSGRFYIPDVTFIHPEATTAEEERAAIALVVEVTHRRRRRIRS